MAANEGQVNWYADDVILRVEQATDEALTQLAFKGEGYAKIQATQNKQVDTGFMRASIYGIGPAGSNRDNAKAEAAEAADRPMAPELDLPEHTAGIHAAAEYAIYQEMANSFLYRALERLQGIAGGVIAETGRKWL